MEKEEKIRSITLRVAIFFGLTTFTLCIAIFYIQSVLDVKQETISQKDSLIQVLRSDQVVQLQQIQENEFKIRVLKDELNDMQLPTNTIPE